MERRDHLGSPINPRRERLAWPSIRLRNGLPAPVEENGRVLTPAYIFAFQQ